MRNRSAMCLLLLLSACHPEPKQTGEMLSGDEAQKTAQAIEQAKEAVNAVRTEYVGRDAHAKAHGCAKAVFTVNTAVAPELRAGLFATPGQSFKGWIRFSNGSHNYAQADTAKDSRGIAIKLMDVPGERLFADPVEPHSLDLLLIDTPAFLARDAASYIEARGSKKISDYFFNRTFNPLHWRWRELNLMRKGFKAPPENPLSADYFGVLAYQLGTRSMKFSAQACEVNIEAKKTLPDDPDFLGKALAASLRSRSACFDFQIQFQNPAARQHVEDATEMWREADSPWISVARIELPVQEVMAGSDAYCENLSFNPWRTLPDQRPLGELNRMRKDLYRGISAYRHSENHAEQAAPRAW
jgi:catalase